MCTQEVKQNEVRLSQAGNKLDAANKLFSTFRRRVAKERLIWTEIENVQMLGMLDANHVSQDDLRTFYDILQKCYFEPAGLDEVAYCG